MRQIIQMATPVTTMADAIRSMQLQMAEAKGGWRALMAIGGASASAGGLINYVKGTAQ